MKLKIILNSLLMLLCFCNSFAQFAPSVGQIGTTAMHKDSAAFVGWASTCTVIRGYQDISNQVLGYTSTGDSSMALAKAGVNGVVSLGDGGSAIVTFSSPIKNDAGYDFAVFENAFSDTFLELAFVEVSSNGIDYFRFPATSNTQDTVQVGSFGAIDATKINNLAGKYRALYGTPFDLQDLASQAGLNVNNVTHVKIIDVVGCIQDEYASYDSNNHKINDPWNTAFPSGGFDLDAVGVIHQQPTTIEESIYSFNTISIYPNPVRNTAILVYDLKQDENLVISILDVSGRELKKIRSGSSVQGFSTTTFTMDDLDTGIYFLQLKTENETVTRKIIYTK